MSVVCCNVVSNLKKKFFVSFELIFSRSSLSSDKVVLKS